MFGHVTDAQAPTSACTFIGLKHPFGSRTRPTREEGVIPCSMMPNNKPEYSIQLSRRTTEPALTCARSLPLDLLSKNVKYE